MTNSPLSTRFRARSDNGCPSLARKQTTPLRNHDALNSVVHSASLQRASTAREPHPHRFRFASITLRIDALKNHAKGTTFSVVYATNGRTTRPRIPRGGRGHHGLCDRRTALDQPPRPRTLATDASTGAAITQAAVVNLSLKEARLSPPTPSGDRGPTPQQNPRTSLSNARRDKAVAAVSLFLVCQAPVWNVRCYTREAAQRLCPRLSARHCCAPRVHEPSFAAELSSPKAQ